MYSILVKNIEVLLNISVTEESFVYLGQRREQIDISRKNSKSKKTG